MCSLHLQFLEWLGSIIQHRQLCFCWTDTFISWYRSVKRGWDNPAVFLQVSVRQVQIMIPEINKKSACSDSAIKNKRYTFGLLQSLVSQICPEWTILSSELIEDLWQSYRFNLDQFFYEWTCDWSHWYCSSIWLLNWSFFQSIFDFKIEIVTLQLQSSDRAMLPDMCAMQDVLLFVLESRASPRHSAKTDLKLICGFSHCFTTVSVCSCEIFSTHVKTNIHNSSSCTINSFSIDIATVTSQDVKLLTGDIQTVL